MLQLYLGALPERLLGGGQKRQTTSVRTRLDLLSISVTGAARVLRSRREEVSALRRLIRTKSKQVASPRPSTAVYSPGCMRTLRSASVALCLLFPGCVDALILSDVPDAGCDPLAAEVADDGVDNDCNGLHGCYYDEDDDGYAREDGAIRDDSDDEDCLDPGEGSGSEPRTDCDDSSSDTHPGALELCDTVDQDCDGPARDGCPSSAVPSISAVTRSPVYGVNFENAPWCGVPRVRTGPLSSTCGRMAGIVGSYGAYLHHVQAQCFSGIVTESAASPEYAYAFEASGPALYGTAHGDTSGESFVASCPDNQWVVGISGWADCVIANFNVRCAPIAYARSCPTCSDWVATRGAITEIAGAAAEMWGLPFSWDCPSDAVGAEVIVWTDPVAAAIPVIAAIQLVCHSVGYTLQ